MKLVFRGMCETPTVSDCPGVRNPSEATRVLKKTIFTLFFASGSAGSPAAAVPATPTVRARVASAMVPLPTDMG